MVCAKSLKRTFVGSLVVSVVEEGVGVGVEVGVAGRDVVAGEGGVRVVVGVDFAEWVQHSE